WTAIRQDPARADPRSVHQRWEYEESSVLASEFRRSHAGDRRSRSELCLDPDAGCRTEREISVYPEDRQRTGCSKENSRRLHPAACADLSSQDLVVAT